MLRKYLKAGLIVSAGVIAISLAGSALWQWVPRDRTGESQLSPGAERVTVDVRNAGGVHGMARAATGRLRAAGFDVVGMGNAARFDLDSSVVIDRVGSLQTAAAVAEELGIKRVVSEPDSNLFVDVSVRLGSDWTAGDDSPEDPPVSASKRSFMGWLRGLMN